METIRNYLESMFGNLPNTPEVLKAKAELWQMMEDKYNELISEGVSENEAVGTVIGDFGNLDELAETLGIQNVLQEQVKYQGRILPQEEVDAYISAKERSARFVGLGVMLCIVSPIPFLIASAFEEAVHFENNVPYGIATAVFFLILAAAISIFVFDSVKMGAWKYLTRELVCIDYSTAESIHNSREAERQKQAVIKTIGVLLCVFCFVPVAVLGALDANDTVLVIGSIVLFLMVGAGVYFLVSAGGRENAYRTMLTFNDPQTVSGNYVRSQQEVNYTNKTVEQIMSVYNPAILCIYLIWSFLTFDWHITWIIWPVAAVAKHLINNIWGDKKGQAS